mgnify:CR=1 FL=1
MLEMESTVRAKYEQLERELFCQLDNGQDVEVFNQAALMTKTLQFSNGSIYPVSGLPVWERIHDLKLDALEEIIDEAQGRALTQEQFADFIEENQLDIIISEEEKLRKEHFLGLDENKKLNGELDRLLSLINEYELINKELIDEIEIVIDTPFNARAAGNWALGTSSGTMAANTGQRMARPMPLANVSASSTPSTWASRDTLLPL